MEPVLEPSFEASETVPPEGGPQGTSSARLRPEEVDISILHEAQPPFLLSASTSDPAGTGRGSDTTEAPTRSEEASRTVYAPVCRLPARPRCRQHKCYRGDAFLSTQTAINPSLAASGAPTWRPRLH